MGSFLITAPTIIAFVILGCGLRIMEIVAKKERLATSGMAGKEVTAVRGPL